MLRCFTVNGKTVRAIQRRQAEGATDRITRPENQIAATGGNAIGISEVCADKQVVETVSVDIAGAGDRDAGVVGRRLPINLESTDTNKGGQLDDPRERVVGAKDHIGAT